MAVLKWTYPLVLRVKVELALPLINDTLYDCPDAAANSSESWEEKVSTADSLFMKWMKDRLHRDLVFPFVAIISKGVKKRAFASFFSKMKCQERSCEESVDSIVVLHIMKSCPSNVVE
jgi:hypothetical protein